MELDLIKCIEMLRKILSDMECAIAASELAVATPSASDNTQSAATTQIAAEIERGAVLVASTDPAVVQCSMLNWARRLRALR